MGKFHLAVESAGSAGLEKAQTEAGRVPGPLLGHCALINLHRSWLLKCAVIDKAPRMIDLFTAHARHFHNITAPITSRRRRSSRPRLASTRVRAHGKTSLCIRRSAASVFRSVMERWRTGGGMVLSGAGAAASGTGPAAV